MRVRFLFLMMQPSFKIPFAWWIHIDPVPVLFGIVVDYLSFPRDTFWLLFFGFLWTAAELQSHLHTAVALLPPAHLSNINMAFLPKCWGGGGEVVCTCWCVRWCTVILFLPIRPNQAPYPSVSLLYFKHSVAVPRLHALFLPASKPVANPTITD